MCREVCEGNTETDVGNQKPLYPMCHTRIFVTLQEIWNAKHFPIRFDPNLTCLTPTVEAGMNASSGTTAAKKAAALTKVIITIFQVDLKDCDGSLFEFDDCVYFFLMNYFGCGVASSQWPQAYITSAHQLTDASGSNHPPGTRLRTVGWFVD
jgi:hypothetical protein